MLVRYLISRDKRAPSKETSNKPFTAYTLYFLIMYTLLGYRFVKSTFYHCSITFFIPIFNFLRIRSPAARPLTLPHFSIIQLYPYFQLHGDGGDFETIHLNFLPIRRIERIGSVKIMRKFHIFYSFSFPTSAFGNWPMWYSLIFLSFLSPLE